MIYDNAEVVGFIKEFIASKQESISTQPVREDIFEILSRECILLFYPLPDDKIKGCHIKKYIGDNLEQFVFINSAKDSWEQTWTAAHELGHVWQVDKYVDSKCPHKKERMEDVVNRFAAELLLPENDFKIELEHALKDNDADGNRLSIYQFVSVITYLMNTFAAPYKAVIRRLVEIGEVSRNNEDKYLNAWETLKEYYELLMQTKYYTRLNTKTEVYSMENVGRDIDELENGGMISSSLADQYRRLFHTKKEMSNDTTFVIGECDGV